MDQSVIQRPNEIEKIPVFHRDEVSAQRRAGFESVTAAIRPFMPEQHRDFFALLRYLFIATLDETGWPIATVVSGATGFVHSPDPLTLGVDATLPPADLAAAGLIAGQDIGVLGIDLATRRRNRANGTISEVDATGFTVAVNQSFGNCAQYIQRRTVQSAPDYAPGEVRTMATLDTAARHLIRSADTFFVASRSGAQSGTPGGVDVSHRGGLPGFIHIDGDTLEIPDFRGNRYFNTLGNLLGEPRAALLFIDFTTGDLLQLQGVTAIDWTDAASRHVDGAQRSWRFRTTYASHRRAAIPLRWKFVDYAPTTQRAGIWH
jgi:predicted pyridoxine 5'-phosphate oxidase superfamily flavin-nucleotide-binding protein